MIFRYIRGLLTEVPLLKAMIERETADSFRSRQRRHHRGCNAASYKTVRGYTVLAALCDEIAFWPTDDACRARPRGAQRDASGDGDDPERDVAVLRHRPMPERARCSRPTAGITARTAIR